jgi:4-hydroxyphenylacetate 3-monooxygenase
MRTGAEYRQCLRTNRKLWIVGEGEIADVTTHPATQPMVDYYAQWYDRHSDPDWADILLTEPDRGGARKPRAFEIPESADDLRRLGKAISKVSFESAGNVTHTPGYGALIALGSLDGVRTMNVSARQIEQAEDYRNRLAETGRFLTFSNGGMPVGVRLRDDPGERVAVRVVQQRDGGVVVTGKLGLHTAVCPTARRCSSSSSSTRPGCGSSPASAPPDTPTRSCRPSAAVSTSSTHNCGSTTCSSLPSASS